MSSQVDSENQTPTGITMSGKIGIDKAGIAAMNVDQMTDQNKEALAKLGGVDAVLKLLNVDKDTGLTSAEQGTSTEEDEQFQERKQIFGVNHYPEPPMKGFWMLYLESFNDVTLLVLLVAAIVSLVIGMIEHPEKGWIEGTAILIATQIVALVTATNDYQKELQFRDLKRSSDDIQIKVIRDGKQSQISTKKILVGDVVVLQQGDKIPADGLYINGDEMKSNEASLTGEPDDLTKNEEKDPFLLSGCQVTEGYCNMLVIAIGGESRWGRIKARLATEAKPTPLQEKLDDMAALIGQIGTGAAIATFIAMLIIFLIDEKGALKNASKENFGGYILHAFIIGVTIIVVAIPEGLPLAVTISLAYSTKKMLKDNNLIRVLAACETMGNATNICSDKTGTLTQNRMTVVAGWFGGKFYSEEDGLPKAEDVNPKLLELLNEGIGMNSSAVLAENKDDPSKPNVVGSKTEGALLIMTGNWGSTDYTSMRKEDRRAKLYPFNSKKKSMCALATREKPNSYTMYCKGASEIVLKNCSHVMTSDGNRSELDDATRGALNETIINMANMALRTIGIAHVDLDLAEIPDEPPMEGMTLQAIVGIIDPLREDVIDAVKTCQHAGIMVRMVTGDNINTAKAIAKQCGILTAGGTAMEGPTFRKLSPKALDELLPTLQVLARSSPDDKHTLVTRLNGKALPKDEAEWVEFHGGKLDWQKDKDNVLPGYLEEWTKVNPLGGQVVGVTGDGTNDAPALKAGDVGLSMGLSGTDVAKEASDIVIMDDRFSSIVKAVLWGRSVYDNIRKFLQFQLTVNVVALAITFIGAVSGRDPPLNAVMMLWVNLIMDTMGALALGTEPPIPSLLDRRPYTRDASLVSWVMWRNIFTQSLYQLIVLLVLLYAGEDLFGVCKNGVIAPPIGGNSTLDCVVNPKVSPGSKDYTHYSIIFNCFVFCQVFNEFTSRNIGSDWNCLKGVSKNKMFGFIIFITIVFQVAVIEGFGEFTRTTGLDLTQWLVSIAIGAVSFPIGIAMRFIPMDEDPKTFAGYTMDSFGGDEKSMNVDTKESI
jgi:calcium-translocating P-type ATPase